MAYEKGFEFFRENIEPNDLSIREYALFAQADYIRVSAVLIEDGRMLAVKQVLKEQSFWNIPGGKLELGETIAQCAVREMNEETGLEVEPVGLLYVTDRFRRLGNHLVDVTYLVERCGGCLHEDKGYCIDGECIDKISFFPVSALRAIGFGGNFSTLIEEGFPNMGSYAGEFHSFYGC